jgi:ribosomal protein S18 acetylase RimI-like enzyme
MATQMSKLPEKLFLNPVWHALRSKHLHLAKSTALACRYPGDVVPFAAVSEPNDKAMQEFRSLLAPGESTWLTGEEYPPIDGLVFEGTLDCFQMVLPESGAAPDPPATHQNDFQSLTDANAHEMVALTDLAFPGFFRQRTCEMGAYYGVRSASGELIAMGGERLKLQGFSEISGVCTHPSFRGKGLAASIMWQLVRDHRRDGIVSWLHVGCANQRAIELYLRMGFEIVRKVTLHRISRRESPATI